MAIVEFRLNFVESFGKLSAMKPTYRNGNRMGMSLLASALVAAVGGNPALTKAESRVAGPEITIRPSTTKPGLAQTLLSQGVFAEHLTSGSFGRRGLHRGARKFKRLRAAYGGKIPRCARKGRISARGPGSRTPKAA